MIQANMKMFSFIPENGKKQSRHSHTMVNAARIIIYNSKLDLVSLKQV